MRGGSRTRVLRPGTLGRVQMAAFSGAASLGLGQADQSLERDARPIKSRAQQKYSAASADAAHGEPYNEFRRETPVAASKYKKLVINFWLCAHRWTGNALLALFGMLALSRSCGSAQFAARLGHRWPRGTRRL